MDGQSNIIPDLNESSKDDELPQCKIKRNYSCIHCSYFTQNPRFHLTHLRDVHGERIVINKCRLCLYASRHYQKLVRHMKMVHGSTEGITGQSKKRAAADDAPKRQQIKEKEPSPPCAFIFPVEPPISTDNLFNDLELSRNSLKDFAALYFAENHIENIMMKMEEADSAQVAPPPAGLVPVKRKAIGNTFFDNLKVSFIGEDSLVCSCGHESKCFSESVIHQKSCNQMDMADQEVRKPQMLLNSGSTRCQHCRHRCKSSADLLRHLKTCPVVSDVSVSPKKQMLAWNKPIRPIECIERPCSKGNLELVAECQEITRPLEEYQITSCYVGVETATGYGEVTKKIALEDAPISSFRKVFKCPRCSFWASTASRFHVHIVGHLNRKPFKCSLCAYRSNWRWDITKHIRLRTIRNLNHKNARVLMNDETGRQNYTQYNKYIARLKITDNVEDSGAGEPNQSSRKTPSETMDTSLHRRKTTEHQATNRSKYSNQPSIKSVMSGISESSAELVSTVLSDGEGTSFCCRKCDFRHASCDAVLAHVKIHPNMIHKTKPLDLARSQSKKTIAPARNTTNWHVNHPSQIEANQCEGKPFTQPVAEDPIKDLVSLTTSPLKALDSSLPSIAEDNWSLIGGVKSSSVLMGLTTSTGFDSTSNGKRGPSPFRCGHCHQVSNWKHVIQRHCRLKHSAHIRIEAYDRNSDGGTPVYRQIYFPGSEESRQFPDECSFKPPAVNQKRNSNNLIKKSDLKTTSKAKEQVAKEHPAILPLSPGSSPFESPVIPLVDNKKSELLYHLTMQHASNPPKIDDQHSVSPKTRSGQCEEVGGPKKSGPRATNSELNCNICDFPSKSKATVLSRGSLYQEKTKIAVTTEPKLNPEVGIESTLRESEEMHLKSSSSTAPRIPVKTSQKCPYCPFESSCDPDYKDHLQHHSRISQHCERFACEHCDFSACSEVTRANHMRIHFEAMGKQKSATFFTSYDKLELNATEDNGKKDGGAKPHPKTVEFKGEQECSKKEITLSLRCNRPSGRNGERKSTVFSPPASQKKILVNPKTGQVIRRI